MNNYIMSVRETLPIGGKSYEFAVVTTAPTYFEWTTIAKLPRHGLTIKGHSRGSEKTGFYIPELKVFLDAGLRSSFLSEAILVTHCHSDHTASLPMLARRIYDDSSIHQNLKVYVPREHESLFKSYVQALRDLNSGTVCDGTKGIQGVQEGDVICLRGGYFAKVYNLDHSVPCRGYGIVKTCSKLKREHIGKSKQELMALKKTGEEICELREIKVLAYITDSTPEIYKSNDILEYSCIMTECTFLYDDELSIAKKESILTGVSYRELSSRIPR
jgi:ribonuclease Z